VFNAEDGATAGVTQSYAAQIVAAYARELGAEIMPLAKAAPKMEIRARGWYNPELDYRDYMVPGILVQLVTIVGTLLTAMNIVREKELGTLDQLSVTPLSQGVFIAAKLIPLWILALFELTLGLLVARFVFHVPMLGSIPLVFGAAALYLVAALAIGLFVSTLAATQQQAMFVTFFIVMIYLLMSGLFTPIRSMPEWAQWMTQVNPVKHFIEIMRAVLLKGAGPGDVLKPLGALAVFGIVVLSLAVRQYGRRVG
jgi:ABC-2 type transport system permease protein